MLFLQQIMCGICPKRILSENLRPATLTRQTFGPERSPRLRPDWSGFRRVRDFKIIKEAENPASYHFVRCAGQAADLRIVLKIWDGPEGA